MVSINLLLAWSDKMISSSLNLFVSSAHIQFDLAIYRFAHLFVFNKYQNRNDRIHLGSLGSFWCAKIDRGREINKLRRLKDSNTTSRSDNKHQNRSDKHTRIQKSHKSFLGFRRQTACAVWLLCVCLCVCECVRCTRPSFFVHAISCILLFHRHCLPCLWCRTKLFSSPSFLLLASGLFPFAFGSAFIPINAFISLIMNDFHKNHVIDDVSRFSNGFSIYRLMIQFFFFF